MSTIARPAIAQNNMYSLLHVSQLQAGIYYNTTTLTSFAVFTHRYRCFQQSRDPNVSYFVAVWWVITNILV